MAADMRLPSTMRDDDDTLRWAKGTLLAKA